MNRRRFLAASAVLGAPVAFAQRAGAAAARVASTDVDSPLDAIVTYETRVLTRAGVLRQERWQERLVRRPGHVWIERVRPAGTPEQHDGESASEHAAHKHFDFDLAARHLTREADGTLRLEYVDRSHRTVVFVPKAEYDAVGFHGDWNLAAALVPPDAVAKMPVEAAATPGSDARWHVDRRREWNTRVLWSERDRIPLAIEIRRTDGTVRRDTSVKTLPLTSEAALPWAALGGYTRKDYDDFMD